jgi:hypothetical protein
MSIPNLSGEQWHLLLKSKDSRIKELEIQLKQAYNKIQELQRKSRRKSCQEADEIQVTSKDITFAQNEPIDTAQIDHLNSSLASFKYSKPRPSEFKLKIPRAEVRKTISLGPDKRPAQAKIEDLLYSKKVDKKTWANTVKSLRSDPKMLSQTIQQNHERPGKSGLDKLENLDKNEFRIKTKQTENHPKPFSANVERKWQEVDWSQTVLDTYASRNLLEFNFFRDVSIFSPYEVEDLLQETAFENYEAAFVKGIKTLDKLSQELMLPKSSFVIPVKSAENLEVLLKECNKLFRARALVIRILTLIHKREDLLLKIMRFDEEDSDLLQFYEKFQGISQDILQSIGFLSQSGLYLAEFIYLGGNYAQKVLQDEANILELFPGLNKGQEI